MTNSVPDPQYKQPWVIDRKDFGILQRVAEKHGLTATIIEEKAGAFFAIGSAGAQLFEGEIGVRVTGDREVGPDENIDITHEFYDAPRGEAETDGNSAKEKK